MSFLFLIARNYPRYERNHYLKHYQSHVKEILSDGDNHDAEIQLRYEEILTSDAKGQSTIRLDGVSEFIELNECIYIKLGSGTALILPKDWIEQMDAVMAWLKAVEKKYNIPRKVEFDWDWK